MAALAFVGWHTPAFQVDPPHHGCCTDLHVFLKEEPHTHRCLSESGQQETGGMLRVGPVKGVEVRGLGKRWGAGVVRETHCSHQDC